MGEGFPLWSLAPMAWEGREPLRDWIYFSVSAFSDSTPSPFLKYPEIRNSDWGESFAQIFLIKLAFLRKKKSINRLTGSPGESRVRLPPWGAPLSPGHPVRRLVPFFRRSKANIRIEIVSKIQPNRSYGSPVIKETVKGQNQERRNRERQRDRSNLGGALAPPRHGGQGPEGKPFSHLGRRSRKKKKEGGSLPLAFGGAGTPPGPSSSPQSSPTTSPPSSPTLPPSMQRCNLSLTRCNLYLNMVLNAIYYFPMMYGYPMMFE